VRRFSLISFFFLSISLFSANVHANINGHAGVQSFIDHMAKEYHFNRWYLKWLFFNTKFDPEVLKRIYSPNEKLAWDQYQKIFLTEKRISRGVSHWHQYEPLIDAASKEFGVPPSIILALWGVETNFGENSGNFKAMNALSTLAFYYTPRQQYYRKELANLLLLSRRAHLNPLKIKGSYAGALGQCQFMPSSYLTYGYTDKGKRTPDLFNNPADIAYSIGYFLKEHGWKPESPIVTRAFIKPDSKDLSIDYNSSKVLKPQTPLSALNQKGILSETDYPKDLLASVVVLPTTHAHETWIAFNNFYVLTRYNNSALYAMAVYQLSKELERRY
jgi:membrane-bound lytic murein transglycosylase B